MALLVTGNWYEVTWLQTNDAAWSALAPPPGIPAPMADMFVNATTMVIYVVSAATGEFVYYGGTASGFDDTLLATNSAISGIVWTDTDSTSNLYAKDSSNNVWEYDQANGTLRTFSAVQTAAFKAFLP